MKKILFLAKYSHDLKYFEKIKHYINSHTTSKVKCEVLYNIPIFVFEIFYVFKSIPITKDEISEILQYEIKRKSLKYSGFKLKVLSFLLFLSAKLYYIRYSKIIKSDNYKAICVWGGFHVMQKYPFLIESNG